MRDGDRERGQSEALGFLLIFSVVVLTIGLVAATGFVGLESVQDFQRTTNAEQAFTVLADNVDDVIAGNAPGRTTEVRIASATLSLETAETTVAITANGTTNTTTVETRPIVYDSGSGTTITYRSGALIRRDGTDSVMIREPGFVLTEETIVLPVVDTVPAGTETVGGTTAVNVRTRADGTRVLAADVAASDITLTVSSPRADAWERYFERFESDGPVSDVTRSGDSVEVTIDTDRVYVTVHRVAVRFQ